MPSFNRFLGRYGLIRAITSGSRGWLVVASAASGLRLLRRGLAKEPEVVFSEDLRPGHSLVITHLARVGRPGRRSRRRGTEARMEA